ADAASAVGAVLADPPPEAMVQAFMDSGIQYRLRFLIEDYSTHQLIQSEVMTYVCFAFQRNGLEIPYPQRVVQTLMPQERGVVMKRQADKIVAHLAKVDFFAIVGPRQIDSLASEA